MILFLKYIILIIFIFFVNCTTTTTEPEDDFWVENNGIIPVGTASNLEIVTWNIENFAKKGDQTEEILIKLIDDLNYDIYALQEITEYNRINDIIEKLGSNWESFSNNNGFQNLVFIINTEHITIIEDTLMDSDVCSLSIFTKRPHFLEFSFENVEYILINNHFKAFSDEDSRIRRYYQSQCLKSYIDSKHFSDKVILTGDLNDSLTDEPADNVFIEFLEDEENYWFADLEIAQGSYTNWSYPGGMDASIHFDHFLLTNEIFNDDALEITATTLKLENLFSNGWADYEKYLSDHRAVKLLIQSANP